MAAKILIADDSPFAVETLSAMISRLGHKVLVAEDGSRLIAKFKTERPDLLIIDYVMPTGTGADALKLIRELQGGAKVPAIFLTAKEPKELDAGLRQAPLVRILSKPPQREALEAAIAELLATAPGRPAQ